MNVAKFNASMHAIERAQERGLPHEIVKAMKALRYRQVRVYADYGGQADAIVVRDSEGFWISVVCVRVVVTVYHVPNGAAFDKWCFEKLVNVSDRTRLKRLEPVLTAEEVTTRELEALWLDA